MQPCTETKMAGTCILYLAVLIFCFYVYESSPWGVKFLYLAGFSPIPFPLAFYKKKAHMMSQLPGKNNRQYSTGTVHQLLLDKLLEHTIFIMLPLPRVDKPLLKQIILAFSNS